MATLITRLVQDRQYEPDSRVIPGRFTYKDVAGYLGIRWETDSQNINDLVKHHVIEWNEGRIKVLDEDTLKAAMTN